MSVSSTLSSWQSVVAAWLRALLGRLLDWLKRSCVLAFRKVCDWWREILAFVAPFVVLAVLVWGPDIPAALRAEASIGTIAAVQGAVTGLSLIALVLAVELARRQEDRDDTVYEIMLGAAGIRPTFIFAIVSLLATLTVVAIADFSGSAQGTHPANLLLCAYLLTGAVGVALLATVLRTVLVLRPTGVIEYRFKANDRERRENVAAFISRTVNEYPTLDPVERVLLPHRPLGLTATERLFVEVDDALQSQHAARFGGALQRLRLLVSNSADQIAESGLGFQAPGQPRYGYWFPLDALQERLAELWRSAFARQGNEFTRELWSFQYWLVMTGVERRAGELLELGLRSGLIGYQAAREAKRSRGHARYEWLNLKGAWWRLRPIEHRQSDPATEVFVARLIEYLQEYGDMLLRSDDPVSFRNVMAEFSQAFFDRAKDRWRSEFRWGERNEPLSSFEYAVMALLALAGRAMALKEQGKLTEIGHYLEPIKLMVDQFAFVERYVPAAYEPQRPLHQQWGWWETDGGKGDDSVAIWIAPEQYVMLPLLANLLESESTAPLPSLGGFAQQFIDTWMAHQELLLGVAGIVPDDRTDAIDRFSTRLATAKAAEEREDEDLHLSAPLDQERVSRFLENLRLWRRNDRVVEMCFEQVGRVRRLEEGDWGDEGRLGGGLLLPRAFFVDDVALASPYAEWFDKRLVDGVETGLVSMMAAGIEGSSEVHDAPSADLAHLMVAVDDALMALGVGRQAIVFVGKWPNDLHSNLRSQMYDRDHGELLPVDSQHYQVTGAYKGHWILWIPTAAEPAIAVVNLDHWGWLVRAPVNGEDFGVGLDEIDQAEAEERARTELPGDADEATLAERVRQLRLRVRARAEERTRFEVENPDAARIIRVAASNGDSAHNDS